MHPSDEDLPPPRLTRPYVAGDPDEDLAITLEWAAPQGPPTRETVPSGKHRVDAYGRPIPPPPSSTGHLGFAARRTRRQAASLSDRLLPLFASRRFRIGFTAVVVALNLAAIAVIAAKTADRHRSSGIDVAATDAAATIGPTWAGAGEPTTAGPAGSAVATATAADSPPPLTIPDLPTYSPVPAGQGEPAPPPARTATNAPRPTPPPMTTAGPPAGSRSAYTVIEGESYSAQGGTKLESCTDVGGGTDVGFIANGDWVAYAGVDFTGTAATQFRTRVASGVPNGYTGRVDVRLDGRGGPSVGGFTIGNTADGSLRGWATWRTVSISIAPTTGVHTVYLTFSANNNQEFVNVNWLAFNH
jgi:hypothetical protein